MADLLRVTAPLIPKSYDYTQKFQPNDPEQVFNLGDTTRINQTTEKAEEFSEQNLKDSNGQESPKLEAAISKNPVLVSVLLRSLIGTDAMEIIKTSSAEELINKITQFANEIMLKPDKVLDDILRQESETTIFSGELFASLKELLGQCSSLLTRGDFQLLNDLASSGIISKQDLLTALQSSSVPVTAEGLEAGIKLSESGMNPSELAGAIVDFMKADIDAATRDDIIRSLVLNLRYLASEVAHSNELAQGLNNVADNLTAGNFSEYKNSILSLLDYTQGSLILNDQSKNLLPLIIYNMSRFNPSSTALSESFSQIINLTGGNPELSAKLSEQFMKYIENSDLPPDIKMAALKSGENAVTQYSMSMLTERIADSVKAFTNRQASPSENPQADNTGGINTGSDNPDALRSEIPPQDANSRSGISASEYGNDLQEMSKALSAIDTTQGTESIKQILMQVAPDNMGGAVNTLLRDFVNSRDLNLLINRLSIIINSIDNLDKKIMVAQSLNEVLGNLTTKEGINYYPPTSKENMYDFLVKNINDPALKSLSSMDRGQMVEGLLNAPGVQTPLLHYLIPVNMDGFKAFGELWADPNPDDGENGGKDGAKDSSHMFLCFEIENNGYFELEVYSRGQNLNILLLCPPGTEKQYHPLKESLPVLAEACGYRISNAAVGPLNKKRDLGNVFPKINIKRSGLDVKV